jgi:hypothetical protein
LKAYVRSLVNDIDAEKIGHFSQSKIVSCIRLIHQSPASVKSAIEKIKVIVKELRHELPEVESITFSGSKDTFDWVKLDSAYSVVDIKARGIEFQVALKTFYP